MTLVRAVVVDAVRSPVGRGKVGGALADIHPSDLLGQVLTGLVGRSALDPGLIDDVIVGCVNQSGEQSATPGRQALLSAGFPEHVPSVTVERKCGSGQQAVDFAVQGVLAGSYDVVVAAGVESMSRVPMGSASMGMDPQGPGVRARFPHLVPQGIAAELVAHKWRLSRTELDEYSARSHERAAYARAQGWFNDEIVAITTPTGVVLSDETIREGTTTEKLGKLRPAFDTEAWRAKFPDLDWRVTAGNSSQLADGASALLIMSEERALELGLTPRAAIRAAIAVGDDPNIMLTGPIPATERVLAKAGLTVADISAYEVNEAFASVPLAWQREIGASDKAINPVGGAVALGHPLGASGVRLMTTLINHLERIDGRFGLQTMCEAGGMANATVIERL